MQSTFSFAISCPIIANPYPHFQIPVLLLQSPVFLLQFPVLIYNFQSSFTIPSPHLQFPVLIFNPQSSYYNTQLHLQFPVFICDSHPHLQSPVLLLQYSAPFTIHSLHLRFLSSFSIPSILIIIPSPICVQVTKSQRKFPLPQQNPFLICLGGKFSSVNFRCKTLGSKLWAANFGQQTFGAKLWAVNFGQQTLGGELSSVNPPRKISRRRRCRPLFSAPHISIVCGYAPAPEVHVSCTTAKQGFIPYLLQTKLLPYLCQADLYLVFPPSRVHPLQT